MESRTAIFSMLVRDAMRDVPLAVPMATTLSQTVRRMESAEASSATVTDAEGCPVRFVTEHDITRRRTGMVLTTSNCSRGPLPGRSNPPIL